MLKIGHRGAPGNPRYGENTLGSFKKAFWKGANAIELDVRLSKDGQCVVIHDATVDRTTNKCGKVMDLTANELQNLDAGNGCGVPTLQEVLMTYGFSCFCNIELKVSGLLPHISALLDGTMLRSSLSDTILISAFDTDDCAKDSQLSWEELSLCDKDISIALLATAIKVNKMGIKRYVETAKEFGAFAIHPQFRAVTSELVQYAHQNGLLVNTWTVNDLRDVARLKGMGVDGIASDFPELL